MTRTRHLSALRRLTTVAASAALVIGSGLVAVTPAAAVDLGTILLDCEKGGTPVVSVTGQVGDTITVRRKIPFADCAHTSSTAGIVSWVADARNTVGVQDPSYTWSSNANYEPATITITLLREGTTQWRASQWRNGLILDITVLPAPPGPLEIESTGLLPGGAEGEPYTSSLGALGGTTPYTWSVTDGSLPPGLSLAPTGEISGTPTSAGTYEVTVTLTDDAGQTASQAVTIVIEPGAVSEENVPICHATSDGYELVMTTEAVFDGGGEHGDHTGDIVPDILRAGSGRNWDATGIAVFFAGCVSGTPTGLDADEDGLADRYDADDDGDGLADIAERDDDADGTPDAQDADSTVAPDQDSDGLPDALDPDDDADCLVDADDPDRDGDGITDAVDPDLDNDLIPDAQDADRDGDGVANLLDLDVDGDGIANRDESGLRSAAVAKGDCPADAVPDDASRSWIDTDSDGIPNVSDPDVDNDGVPNAKDEDGDGDGVIDTRDKDANADGIVETRRQPLAKKFRLPTITPGVPLQLTTGPLATVAGQNATVDVTCAAAPKARSKGAGDIGEPDASGRCLVVKSGKGLRLYVYPGKATTVSVQISAPAVDTYRPLNTVSTVRVG